MITEKFVKRNMLSFEFYIYLQLDRKQLKIKNITQRFGYLCFTQTNDVVRIISCEIQLSGYSLSPLKYISIKLNLISFPSIDLKDQ